MKIVLIHGDNKQKVQERVRQIVDGVHNKGWKVERLDKNANLAEEFMSNTLLPESKLCIYEGVSNLKKDQILWLKDNIDKVDGSFLIVNQGDAPKKNLQPISKLITEEHFTYPKILFIFLESLVPGKARVALTKLHELTANESIELTSAMLGRHLRDMYWVKNDPESIKGPEWRKKKLLTQANTYSDEKLSKLISELAEIDYQAKTGGTDLQTALDVLLIKELS